VERSETERGLRVATTLQCLSWQKPRPTALAAVADLVGPDGGHMLSRGGPGLAS
jgi:hypothetical protein